MKLVTGVSAIQNIDNRLSLNVSQVHLFFAHFRIVNADYRKFDDYMIIQILRFDSISSHCELQFVICRALQQWLKPVFARFFPLPDLATLVYVSRQKRVGRKSSN